MSALFACKQESLSALSPSHNRTLHSEWGEPLPFRLMHTNVTGGPPKLCMRFLGKAYKTNWISASVLLWRQNNNEIMVMVTVTAETKALELFLCVWIKTKHYCSNPTQMKLGGGFVQSLTAFHLQRNHVFCSDWCPHCRFIWSKVFREKTFQDFSALRSILFSTKTIGYDRFFFFSLQCHKIIKQCLRTAGSENDRL